MGLYKDANANLAPSCKKVISQMTSSFEELVTLNLALQKGRGETRAEQGYYGEEPKLVGQ